MERALATTCPGEAVAIFALARAAATGLLSIPTEGISRSRAAKFVVPRPQNGSITQSPRLLCVLRKRSGAYPSGKAAVAFHRLCLALFDVRR
jgi:hypothetical protein